MKKIAILSRETVYFTPLEWLKLRQKWSFLAQPNAGINCKQIRASMLVKAGKMGRPPVIFLRAH